MERKGRLLTWIRLWKSCYLLLITWTNTEVTALNVLLFPSPIYSHCFQPNLIANELLSRGHRVTAYVPDYGLSAGCLENSSIQRIYYRVNNRGIFDNMTIQFDHQPPLWDQMQSCCDYGEVICLSALSDSNKLHLIHKMNFDLALVTCNFEHRCLFLIPYKYRIPFVALQTTQLSWFENGSPFVPNIIPHVFLGYPYKMAIVEKVINFWATLIYPFIFSVSSHYEIINKFVPELSLYDYIFFLQNQAELFIEDSDLVLNGPVPLMPNTVWVGAFSPHSPKPLPPDIETFYGNARHGVIFVAFGSFVDRYAEKFDDIFGTVFSSIQQHVLWKHPQVSLSKTVMTRDWLPQNDVLGHTKTILFISHCGRKSLYDAVFHGVPMVCIPFGWDQFNTAERIVSMGIGASLDMSLNPTKLSATMLGVLQNDTYQTKMKLWSNIYKDLHRRSPAEETADALEHIAKYGGKHLRSVSQDQSFVEILMIDVWGIIGLFGFSLLYLCVSCAKCFLVSTGRRCFVKQNNPNGRKHKIVIGQ